MTWGTPRVQPIADTLYVVTAVSNPVRYASRYDLYARFKAHMASFPQVELRTVELAYGDRAFEVTSPSNPHDLQLRTSCEIWHKENLINLAIQRLPLDWKYVAWIDADVTFANPHWADEALHSLQHYAVSQLFTNAIDLGPNGEHLATFNGFGYSYTEGKDPGPMGKDGYVSRWHPGFAWAMTRDAFNEIGGLIDWAVLGSADTLMAHAFIQQMADQMFNDLSPGLQAYCRRFRDRAKALKANLGYVPGTLVHHWHGKKADRRYWDRRAILVKYQFDPHADLKPDSQGVYQLTDRSIGLRDAIRAYFRARNEDGKDNEAPVANVPWAPPKKLVPLS